MKWVIKILILFLIIFKFRIPVVYDTAFLSIALCSFYYLFTRKAIPLTYFTNRYVVSILMGLILLCVVILIISVAHSTFDFTLLAILSLQSAMLFALIYALPLLLEGEEDRAFESASTLICYAFAIQSLIQFSAFMIPPFGDFMIKIKPPAWQEYLLENAYNLSFRGYALTGSAFFELPAGYGVAAILLIRLLSNEQQTYIVGITPYVIGFLFVVGAIFSGRTAFIGFATAVVMSLFTVKNIRQILIRIIPALIGITLLIIIVFQMVPENQRKRLQEDVFPFAFEFYYNYESTGKLSTQSSDIIFEKHYFYLQDETLLYGDGLFSGSNGSFYMNTDAGWMRNALFGGIPFVICIVIYQLLYFIKPAAIAWGFRREREGYVDFICILSLCLFVFVLEFKGSAVGLMNIMEVLLLFIGCSYLIRNDWREENELQM